MEPINKLKQELQTAQTVGQFLEIVGKHYDLDASPLGPIQRVAMISQIGGLLKLTNAKPKKQ